MSPKRTYHHGDLKRALIEAAVEILDEEGAAALTLRAAARRAGVSRQAPYNHFRDVDHLIAGVASEAFTALADFLDHRRAEGELSGPRQLQEMGIGYVRFAVENPGRFRVMFGPQLRRREEYPELAAAADGVFRRLSTPPGVLFSGGVGRQEPPDATECTKDPEPVPPLDVRVPLWSLVHGLAHLLVDRQLTLDLPDGEAAERYARAATRTLWVGLADGLSR